MRRRRLLVLVLLSTVLAATVLAAAPPAAAGGGRHRPATEGRGTTLALNDLCFSPTVLRVAPGSEVTIVNRDAIEHPLARPGGEWGWDGAPGDRATVRLDRPGIYPFFCHVHPGMVGVVVVAAVVACVIAGLVITGVDSSKRYESSARVLFGTSALSDAALQVDRFSDNPEREAATNVLLAGSEAVAAEVRRRLGLSTSSADLLDKVEVEAEQNANVLQITPVGGAPSALFAPVVHAVPMMGLDNAMSQEELAAWVAGTVGVVAAGLAGEAEGLTAMAAAWVAVQFVAAAWFGWRLHVLVRGTGAASP